MTVQKVSNLILNMNLYVADPQTDKFTFIKSVDIRDNTDESWSRSLNYLLKNYFLPKGQPNSG
jgi:predicted methyltransferase